MFDWMQDHKTLLTWLGIASLVMFAIGIVLVPLVIVRMPHDYFAHQSAPDSWRSQHPALRITLRLLKNILGATLILAGIAMLVLPGQGVLTILLGITLLEFPGKRALELWIVRRNSVQKPINWIRAKWNRPPIALPEASNESDA